MEIKTRADALAAGEKTYYTGKPCRNGHTSYRYTQSATCAACVTSASSKSREAFVLPVSADERETRRALLACLQETLVRCYPVDLPAVRSFAYVLASARFPTLLPADVGPHKPPVMGASGTVMYKMLVPPQDVQAIRDFGVLTTGAHTVDIQSGRMRAAEMAARIIEENTEPVPEFRP